MCVAGVGLFETLFFCVLVSTAALGKSIAKGGGFSESLSEA